MIRTVEPRVWAFDIEWIPDPLAGRLLLDLSHGESNERIFEAMWQAGGATDEDPTPFLKLIQCRVVSIAAVERRARSDAEVSLRLLSLPRDTGDPEQAREASVIGTFLDALGQHRPQLVGFHSLPSDLKILIQRGVVLGLSAPGFCQRPDKPWEGIDYFARDSRHNLDLKELLGGFGKASFSLHEIAVQSGIPGKMDMDGNDVARQWLDGGLRRIVDYNELDALTTYLVWLRAAHFAGRFTRDQYEIEQERVRELLETESATPGRSHLEAYRKEWDRLRSLVEQRS